MLCAGCAAFQIALEGCARGVDLLNMFFGVLRVDAEQIQKSDNSALGVTASAREGFFRQVL